MLLAGCATPKPVEQLTTQQELTRALARDDRYAFAAQFDQPASGAASQLFHNLRQLRPVVISGADDDTVVDWTLGGRSASTHLTVTRAVDGTIRAVAATGQQPLWLTNPVEVTERGSLTFLAVGGVAAWLDEATAAAAYLSAQRFGVLSAGWDGRLVVEAPHTSAAFRALLAQPSETAAAVAFAEGGPDGPIRVVVNPAALGLPSGDKRATLIHEGVHVATSSPRRAAPLWVTEGLAEATAILGDPLLMARRDRLARSAVARGVPRALPPDAAFAPDAAHVEEAYALASVAIEAMLQHQGRTDTLRDLAAWSGVGTTQRRQSEVLSWYRAHLKQLAR